MLQIILISIASFVGLILMAFLYYVNSGKPVKLPADTNRIIQEILKSNDLPEFIKYNTVRVTNGDVKIWYESITQSKTPKATILLIMGHSCPALIWDAVFFQKFVDSGYQVIRYDNRGLGESSWMKNWTKKNAYTLEDMAKDPNPSDTNTMKFGVAVYQMIKGSGDYEIKIKRVAQKALYEKRRRKGANPRVGPQHDLAIGKSGSRLDELSKINLPALIIHGKSDPLVILAHHYGWRVALYALGVPGVLFAVIVYFTVKEPVKGAMDNKTTDTSILEQRSINTKEAVKILQGNKTFVFISLATGFHSFGMYAAGSWLPSFFIRSHGMDLQTVGITLGLLAALFGGLGAFGGGFITDKLRKKDMRWYLWLPLLTTILVIPLVIVIFFAKSLNLVLIFLALYYLITAMYIGPSVSVVQSLFPAEMRAFASSIFLFVLNSIGLGLGPLTVGIVSDYLEPTLGEDALRWAFTVTFIATIIATFLFNIASRSYKKDLAAITEI